MLEILVNDGFSLLYQYCCVEDWSWTKENYRRSGWKILRVLEVLHV